ncbi:MAG: hypothetical protein WAM25_16685 [Candidatus Acidiferrales bacterium]
MRGILFLAVLTVKSSYSRDIELSVEGPNDVPDTLQWWFGANGCWRIHTYALDHDIHAYQLGNSPQTTLELAKQNNQKNYGDVIAAQHVIHFVDCANRGELEAEFGRIGFVPRLEVDVDHGRFAFWKPDDAVYSTKSSPKKRSHNLP